MKINEIIGQNTLDTAQETILTDEQYKAITSNWKLVAAFAAHFPFCLSYGPYKDYRIVYYKNEHNALKTFETTVRYIFKECDKWFTKNHGSIICKDDAYHSYKTCLFLRSCVYLENEEIFVDKTEDIIV